MVPPPLKAKNCISDEELFEVKKYMKTSGYFETSKVGGMEIGLIQEFVRLFQKGNKYAVYSQCFIFRLVALQKPLSEDGQFQLKRILARRSRRFARKLGEFHRLKKPDQENVMS